MRRLDPQRFAGQIGGCEVGLYTLRSPQIEASWCNHGARLLQLIVPDREGRLKVARLGDQRELPDRSRPGADRQEVGRHR